MRLISRRSGLTSKAATGLLALPGSSIPLRGRTRPVPPRRVFVHGEANSVLGRACVLRLERTGRDLGPITYLVQLVAGRYKEVRDANSAQAGTVTRLGVILHQIRGDHILAGLLLGLGEGLIRKGRLQRNGSKRRLLLLVEKLY